MHDFYPSKFHCTMSIFSTSGRSSTFTFSKGISLISLSGSISQRSEMLSPRIIYTPSSISQYLSECKHSSEKVILMLIESNSRFYGYHK